MMIEEYFHMGTIFCSQYAQNAAVGSYCIRLD